MVDPAQSPENAPPDNIFKPNIFKPRVKAMTKSIDPNQLLYAEDLLKYYKFALDGQSTQEVLQSWADVYPVEWIRQAIVEALYQGRYKVVSVNQILQIWQRRQQAQPHFDADFEQLIRQRLPQNLNPTTAAEPSAVAALAAEIHSQAHILPETDQSPSSTLEGLTQFVQGRRSRKVGIDSVIDQAEANVNMAADQAKKTLHHESTNESKTSESPSPAKPSKAIGEFTPQTSDSDLIAKLRRSVAQSRDKTAS